ncbi:phosphoglycolate phosphatase [Polycladidibacter stylochi]|uniref:phosphoglycolate phosphatase n=1 Tax=Polycladidibacter stylochi TaxID=1807766 RepID=UPI00082A9603|nr:phosphoglycolate phosphatase [Pseudovibrio stylochi]
MTGPVLVFDLDGTLVETMGDLTASLNHALEHAGFEAIEADRVRRMVGAGVKVLVERGLEYNKVQPSAEVVEPMLERFVKYYEAHICVHSHTFDGAVQALEALKDKGWKLAICTNKLEGLAKPLIRALGIEQLFDAVVGGDTFSKNKPDAMPVFGAIDMAGGTKRGSVFIGDSRTDIEAARNAGLPVIAVDFGYTDVPVIELKPDVVISHFNELENAIDSFANAE